MLNPGGRAAGIRLCAQPNAVVDVGMTGHRKRGACALSSRSTASRAVVARLAVGHFGDLQVAQCAAGAGAGADAVLAVAADGAPGAAEIADVGAAGTAHDAAVDAPVAGVGVAPKLVGYVQSATGAEFDVMSAAAGAAVG